jgi:hypothetical protein
LIKGASLANDTALGSGYQYVYSTGKNIDLLFSAVHRNFHAAHQKALATMTAAQQF